MNEIMTGGFGLIELFSLLLNLLLGGSLIVTLKTLKSTKIEAAANAKKAEADAKKAEAEAKHSELDNTEAVIKFWRELAESISTRQEALSMQVEELSVEVRRLKNATNRVIRLLDRITPENLDEMVKKIKDEIEIDHTDIVSDSGKFRLPITSARYPGSGPND